MIILVIQYPEIHKFIYFQVPDRKLAMNLKVISTNLILDFNGLVYRFLLWNN